ncbi:MAG: pyridoxal phosphate-dependent aminotransferase [Candidatus Pacebacteria bacterium]|nr:pyridoxal phosphate-dependent aminotransferase [Candidatus Paceibacterota bacterium]
MRTNIVHPGADELVYEIREIVEVANRLESLGLNITWENIGDPVEKGERVPDWIKEIVSKASLENSSYGYSPTKGLLESREYIVHERNIEGGIQITADDILFFNGLGDAITKIYQNLNPKARIIGPNPAYPTHSSAEAAHADSGHITYQLDPKNNWEPNLDEIRRKVRDNKDIVGILIINPDNPTGFVYSQETIKKIVDIARENDLFIISDEIYSNLFFPESGMKKLASVIGDVPAIAMRGISKEFPWPGARCGWIEFYNRDKDENFNRYTKSIIDSKMLEVCSTTLPQLVLPRVMKDNRYFSYLDERIKKYERRSDYAYEVFSKIPELVAHKAKGAFYFTVIFKEGVLNDGQSLHIEERYKDIIGPLLGESSLDKRFVYCLLASTGICIVPMSSGFNSTHMGFRMTLLEEDDQKFEKTVNTIAESIKDYIG